MVPKFRTRDVEKSLYINYFKRAEECLHAAKNSFNSQKWNAATISAIHYCIAACDAMCVYFLGKLISDNYFSIVDVSQAQPKSKFLSFFTYQREPRGNVKEGL